MGMDVTIKRWNKIVCPHCGKLVTKVLDREENDSYEVMSGGSEWHKFKDMIGYGDKQYNQDVELTNEQVQTLKKFVNLYVPYNSDELYNSFGRMDENKVLTFEADW